MSRERERAVQGAGEAICGGKRMSESEWWYKNKDGEKTGPAPVDLLEALWLAGEMDGLTLVWQEGMPDFLPVSQVS